MPQTVTGRTEMTADTIAKVRAVYAELATRPIERNCIGRAECCHFKLTGLTPFLTKGEAIVAAKAWRASGRKKFAAPADGSCPMLDPQTARCLIYADRPFGCRTHFCAAAGGPYERRDVIDLIRRLEAIDANLGGDGPRRLPAAVADALSND
ncbi:MAG: YkgJ family cysteine cluster protein [Verrucomicrobiota bacterium]|nr:YkgJ family cysteine cluster protein [Verrucomicrobiota bacterium]